MKKNESVRLLIIFSLFVLLSLATIFKLFFWQIVEAKGLSELEKKQSSQSLVTTAKRGDILFSDKFPLATNKISYLLYANPKQVENVAQYANALSPILEVDKASISATLSKDLFWVSLKSRLAAEKKAEIDALKLNALGITPQAQRYYPEASIAAHLVGFVGKNKDGIDTGYFGLEGYYDRQLQGRQGRIYVVKDALGNPILTDVREEKKIDGRNLVLSIDRTIQFIIDKQLKKAIEKYDAQGGSVILMEPSTGRILGMASYPKFDPEKYYEYEGDLYRSPLVSSLYEPGSTFKVLIMGAALDKGLVVPDTKCDICGGPVEIGEYKIKTWNDKYSPNITMTKIIEHSDNTGMVFVGRKLGVEGMSEYLSRFGFGELTNIDLQGEIQGSLRPKNTWAPIDLATSSFGQGISVTPIQLLSAVSSIANGGNLMRPSLVSKITTEDGREIEVKPEVKKRTVSEKTAKLVTWMMVNAVENGEAKWTKIPNFMVAGKTGTAQVPINGHYDPNQTIASFVGFFPAKDPKISMLVLINKPKSSIYGADTAAPLFFSIARELIQYYNIQPSQ